MEELKKQKPLIETTINGAALLLIGFGAQAITVGNFNGYLMVIFGVALEYCKYYGRKAKLWK